MAEGHKTELQTLSYMRLVLYLGLPSCSGDIAIHVQSTVNCPIDQSTGDLSKNTIPISQAQTGWILQEILC